jgi:rhodanese-related sulfurtransferase
MLSFLRRGSTPEIDVDELDRLIAERSVRVLDVREDPEWARGHVVGAVHVPVRRLPERIGQLKRDTRYAVICASGSRSRGATDYLIAQGFEGAVSVRGGTSAWARSGRLLAR